MTIDSAVFRALQSLPLFAALPEDELLLLAERLTPVQFADGAAVVVEGDQCSDFYIVSRGEVSIVKALGTPDERLLAVRPAGTVVGELSLFSPGGRHTASVLARGPLDMLLMTRSEFDSLLARQPRLAYGMVQTLSLRLIESEQTTIRDLHLKNESLARALADLQAAQAALVEKEKLERELEVARRIQSSLLPHVFPVRPGLDLAAGVRPMSAVGGDFYDFVEFPDGRLGLAIGDVSDHGVPAALFMTMTITLLRSAARTAGGSAAAPADVLRGVNRGLLEFDMSGMFVTLLYGVFDPRQREFAYARAGHEPPLLLAGVGAPAPAGQTRAADESGLWIVDRSAWGAAPSPAPASRRRGKGALPLSGKTTKDEGRKTNRTATSESGSMSQLLPSNNDPSSFTRSVHTSSFNRGQILGVVPDPQLDVQRLPLLEHSLLLLYTDGAREAWNATGEMFGEKGLRALLAEAAHEPALAICERLFRRLADFRGPGPQQDDITLVAIKT
jgi:serine phosphatase RsbU (regulator of sigma subunit)